MLLKLLKCFHKSEHQQTSDDAKELMAGVQKVERIGS